jgi:hypothetical protein
LLQKTLGSGSPFINQLKTQNGEIINNKNRINELICKDFERSHKWHYPKGQPCIFPRLEKPRTHLIKQVSSTFSKDKAITSDGVTDHLFKLHGKCYRSSIPCPTCRRKIIFMKNVWDYNFWTSNNLRKKSFICRLLPMNKKPSQIPCLTSYRPLVILSPF